MDVKVFEMNDCDWVAAVSLESAKAYYMQEHGGGQREEDAMYDPHELTEEQMNNLIFVDDGKRHNFKEQLALLVAERVKFPCLFASTEY